VEQGSQKPRLRIVHCFRSPVGGIFRHVRDLSEAQSAAGHDVGIICDSTTGGDFEARLFAEMKGHLSLGVHRTPMQRHIGVGDAGAALRTFGLIKELRPDILHGHGAKGGVYARLFGSLLRVFRYRVARLYSPHGGSLHYDERTATGRLFFAIENVMGRFTDHILFVSDYERRTYRRKIGEPRAPFTLVYNGVKASEFQPVEKASPTADFLFIGMMRDLKGPDIFIDALAEAGGRLGRPLTAVMVGEGLDRQKYVEQARRLGLAEAVRFLPPMPAREAFALAEIIVVPSRAEAMPYIVLEALAAGMPMIASSVGGIPEIFPAGSPALILPDRAQLAARMLAALGDIPGFGGAMPGVDDLKARFGADVMAERIERVYLATLGGNAAESFEPA
jgi:glycosyltransferase involved in cell wall biosynthesis